MANSYLQFSSLWKHCTDRFGVFLKCCSALWRTRSFLPWLLFWPIPILKLKIVVTASFLRSSPRLESRNQRTSCREILFKAVFCEMVRTPYKRVNVLSFEMYHNIKFSSFGKSNILILDLKLLLQFVAAQNTMGFR